MNDIKTRTSVSRSGSKNHFNSVTTVFARWLPLLLPWMLTVAVLAQDFTYMTEFGTITITGYTGSGGAVTIPSSINDTWVASIGARAFANRSSLTSVTIPGVTIIRNNAFDSCTSLTNVTLSDGLIRIGDGAFSRCGSLTNVTIPDSVTSIGDDAFSRCTNLTSFRLPKSVTSIGGFAFLFCPNLSALTVDALNLTYSSVDGVLFDQLQTTLIQYPGGKAGSYTMPDSVTSIGDNAFYGCPNLTQVTIGNHVTRIGVSAFNTCSNLAGVTMPNSVVSLGNGAFGWCPSLAKVTIGNGVSTIGDWAFESCTGLTNVIIPSSVTSIGLQAFAGCQSLTSVLIPRSVTSIRFGAFSACTSLKSITVDALNPFYTSVDGVLFDKNQTVIIQYPGGKSGNYTVPNPITTISDYAFTGCDKLTGVYFQSTPPTVSSNVFSYSFGAAIYYLPGIPGWGPTLGGHPTTLWKPQVLANGANFGVRTSQFGFDMMWAGDRVVVVEACTNLTTPAWTEVGTKTLIEGSAYFSDPQWTLHPVRFYRLRSP